MLKNIKKHTRGFQTLDSTRVKECTTSVKYLIKIDLFYRVFCQFPESYLVCHVLDRSPCIFITGISI